MFVKYQHIERLNTIETEGILEGIVYVFPKIDGTSGSLWCEDGTIHCGSRRREVTEEDDNQGFATKFQKDPRFTEFFNDYPNLRLFGEYLIPHSLKTYRDDAWREFYVFDVTYEKDAGYDYIIYEDYAELLEEYGINYIPPIAIRENPTEEDLLIDIANNKFLIQDGKGDGEGIVVKNYSYVNRYGRRTWAKIVTNEFKEKHVKAMGAPTKLAKRMVESDIVEELLSEHMVEKAYAKILVEEDGWSSKFIKKLLDDVYYDIIKEELPEYLSKNNKVTINFGGLFGCTVKKIKAYKPELF